MCCRHNHALSSFVMYRRIFNNGSTTGATGDTGTVNYSGASEISPAFIDVECSCCSIFNFLYIVFSNIVCSF